MAGKEEATTSTQNLYRSIALIFKFLSLQTAGNVSDR